MRLRGFVRCSNPYSNFSDLSGSLLPILSRYILLDGPMQGGLLEPIFPWVSR